MRIPTAAKPQLLPVPVVSPAAEALSPAPARPLPWVTGARPDAGKGAALSFRQCRRVLVGPGSTKKEVPLVLILNFERKLIPD